MGTVLIRYCKQCGEKFIIFEPQRFGARKYCCDACRDEHEKMRQRKQAKKYYNPVKPHELTCKKCGKTFLGKWGAGYCMDCLTDGSAYMTKLLCNRTVPV